MKDFHLPLPPSTYADLRAEAERCQGPATAVAREAIAIGLGTRKSSPDGVPFENMRKQWPERGST